MSKALNIASIGMVTAVGLDAPSSCAAIRAHLDGFQETRFVGSDGEYLTGAPIPLPRNWTGEARLAHMAAAAICEAFEKVPEARAQTALMLCLPEEDRPGRPVRDDAALLRQICAVADLPAHPKSRIIAHGRPSVHIALEQARELLAKGDVAFVMIAGVDSYLTSLSISHYIGAERLLTPDNPDGFIPGEAAAAILCVKSRSRFRLFGLGLSQERASIYNSDDLPMRADGMTEAYSLALAQTGIAMNQLGYRISDLIGESYWFKQTALASLRLLRERHEFQDLLSSTESLGNVGAAAGPIMVGMAFAAAAKGYAPGNPVLIEASNDRGLCGAAIFAEMEAT